MFSHFGLDVLKPFRVALGQEYEQDVAEQTICPSEIFPQSHDPAPDAFSCSHGEVMIPLVERMKDGSPTDFLEQS